MEMPDVTGLRSEVGMIISSLDSVVGSDLNGMGLPGG